MDPDWRCMKPIEHGDVIPASYVRLPNRVTLRERSHIPYQALRHFWVDDFSLAGRCVKNPWRVHELESKLPLFSYGRDGHQPNNRVLYTNYKDSYKDESRES